MNTYFVHLTGLPMHGEEDFLALFIPSISTSYQHAGRGLWCVSSVLTAAQIRNRLDHWTAGYPEFVVTSVPPAAQPLPTGSSWTLGAMAPSLCSSEAIAA